VAIVYTDPETRKQILTYCVASFSRAEDLSAFEEQFTIATKELA